MESMKKAIAAASAVMKYNSVFLRPTRWQSVDVSKQAGSSTYEVLNYSLRAQVQNESLDSLAAGVEPNLPWADDHFEERVGGIPLNPGVQWAKWPWGNSANSFREGDGKFSHSYMERFWPKQAGPNDEPMRGIRHDYGDLNSVVEHLVADPHSRQAYLPIWFPEDTGKLNVRVPCTLGYHFIQRHGYLHCTYYIRSCDFMRHFRDDIYLAVRLQLWILDQLRLHDGPQWDQVKPGLFTMHMVSLHLFENDYTKLFGARQP